MKGHHEGHHRKERKHGGRAHHHAEGGREHERVAGNPDVFKEAEEEHKHGGKVKHLKAHGGRAKHRVDKRARGGRTGRGSDQAPFSSAHTSSHSGGHGPRSEDTYGGLKSD